MPHDYLRLQDEGPLNFTYDEFAYPKELVPVSIPNYANPINSLNR